ncbi:hypothetical protein QR721_10760 [Aciduricibacillus chroicocephali]|uniref:Pilus assembly protein PilO n=1 Tax=Aciduricibacillus chroicocephali TaxID=3054939 RepID=A0ABY9KT86_9BACI|nr:hypothetical protein QR721_10760 [Bacillaceae bacterium 44XB]
MNEQFQERRNLYLALAGLILILLIVLFFAVLKPMTDEKSANEAEALNLQKQVDNLQTEKKRAQNSPDSGQDESTLYKAKMPLNPSLDELMRSLEEIEAISMSRIDKIEFAYDGDLPLPDKEEDTTNPDDAVPDANAGTNDDTATSTDEEDTSGAVDSEARTSADNKVAQLELQAPENLHTIAMRMEVASPDYEHFDMLMKEVEKLDRVTLVNTLEFKKPAEAELVLDQNPDETVTCTVELITFYYDGPVKK